MQKGAIVIVAIGVFIALSMVAVLTDSNGDGGSDDVNTVNFDCQAKTPTTMKVYWSGEAYKLYMKDIRLVQVLPCTISNMSEIELVITGGSSSGCVDTISLATGSGENISCDENNIILGYELKDGVADNNKPAVQATFTFTKGKDFSEDLNLLGIQLFFKVNGRTTNSQVVTIPIGSPYSVNVEKNCVVMVYKTDIENPEITRNQYGSTITQAVKGSIVMIAPYPSDEGKIKSVSVTGSDGSSLRVEKYPEYGNTEAGQYRWFFEMPGCDVNIKVESNAHKLTVNCDENKGSVAVGTKPISIDGSPVGSGKYNKVDFETLREEDNFFKDDVVVLTPTANVDKGYSFKGWRVVSGDAKVAGNNLTMGSQDTTIEPIFEKESIKCNPGRSGTNIVLDIEIDVSDDIGSIKDARVLIVAKYGDKIINVYSKPVLDNGVGTDKIVLSEPGLTQVVLQVVDGFQPASDGSISSVCHYVYEPETSR